MIEIKVPASSANLGAGFDCFGLALELFLTLEIDFADSWKVELFGQGANTLPTTEKNLILKVARFVADAEGVSLPALHIKIDNQIPLARGLGSSAAAIVAGISIVEAIEEKDFPTNKFFHYAKAFENHFDNTSAARYGGFTLALESSVDEVLILKQAWPEQIKTLVTIPDFQLNTEKARSVLPANYSRKDAVFNLQHALLFQAALMQEKFDLISEAILDCWHQPFRAPLVPGLEQALRLKIPGLLGTALSGSGPTLLALTTENFDEIAKSLVKIFAQHNIDAETKLLSVDKQGRTIKQY